MSRTTATAAQFNRLMEMLDNRQRDEALAAARRKHFEKFQVGAERFPGSMRRERISRVGRYSVRGEKMLAYTVTDTDGTAIDTTEFFGSPSEADELVSDIELDTEVAESADADDASTEGDAADDE